MKIIKIILLKAPKTCKSLIFEFHESLLISGGNNGKKLLINVKPIVFEIIPVKKKHEIKNNVGTIFELLSINNLSKNIG